VRRYLHIVGLFCLSNLGFWSHSWAQQNVYDEATILLKNELTGGIHIHANGWGLNVTKGQALTVDRTFTMGLEILGMKHPKEVKQFSQYLEEAKRFSYGKTKAFYVIRPTIGIRRKLTEKMRKNGAEISLQSSLGPSIGLTKPIYLEIIRIVNDGTPTRQISIERYDTDIHSIENINGRASVFKGFDQLKLRPGIFVDTGFLFEYSPYQRGVKAVEAGVMADFYFEEVPIMALEKNKQLFLNFYVNVHIGKKYNRSPKE